MIGYISRRIVHGVVCLVGVVILVFILARLTGSPAALYLPQNATRADIDNFNHQHGFDLPILTQLWNFLRDAVHLNLGDSLLYGQSAIRIVLRVYPATLEIVALAMSLSLVTAVALGATAATRVGRWPDRLCRRVTLLGISVPDFWVALIGITVFAVALGLLPTSGRGSVSYWILPVATLMIRPVGVLTQITRTSMIDALGQDYIRIAKSKGVRPSGIVFKHALRNAALPILTVAGLLITQLINGAVVIETVFAWPGIGNLMVNAINSRDFSLIEAVVLVTGAAIIGVNVLIDICYGLLNPQIRLGKAVLA